MRTFLLAWALASLFLLAVLVPRVAHAAPLDPDDLREQVDDRGLDGDLDAEDLVAFDERAELVSGTPRAAPYVGVGASYLSRDDGKTETVGLVVVGMPLDRWLAPSRSPFGGSRAGIAEGAAPAPAKDPAPAPRPVGPTARAVVQAAFRAAGLGAEVERLEVMAARARASAALPELRLRGMRTTDSAVRFTPTDTDPYRATESGSAAYLVEARFVWRLGRALFADEEVSIERLRVDRDDARRALAGKVLVAFFEWRRAREVVRDASLSSAEHLAAEVRADEAAATLDVLTDGWFSSAFEGAAGGAAR